MLEVCKPQSCTELLPLQQKNAHLESELKPHTLDMFFERRVLETVLSA